MMATRFEKSGELLFCYGVSDASKKPKPTNKFRRRGIWLAALVIVVGMFFFAPHAMAWPAVSHTLKAFVAAIW
jgi:hypothetical protein